MRANGWRGVGRIGIPVLVTLLVVGVTSDALAGRSHHLDYAETKGVELPEPDPDHALVVFLRPQKSGGGVHASVYDDEEFITFVQHNTCFIYRAEPGEHRFMVVSETAKFLAADLEAGKIYFVQVRPKMGTWRARFILYPLTTSDKLWAKLPSWLEKAYMVEPNESAMAWVEGSMDSVLQKKAAKLPEWEAKPPEERDVLKPEDGVTGL